MGDMWSVRPAVPEDAAALFQLNREFNGEGVASPGEMAAALAEPGPERVLLAFAAGEHAGFLCGIVKRSACYRELSAEVTELFVRPDFRRRGAARALLEAFLELCRQEGAATVTLLTGEDNASARRLYESAGFALSGEVHYEREM